MQEKPPAQSASSGSGGVIFPFSFHVFTPGNLNIYSKQFSEMNKIEKVFSLLLLFLLFSLKFRCYAPHSAAARVIRLIFIQDINPPLESLIVDADAARELMCNICLHLLEKPRQCQNGHLFCTDCIVPYLKRSSECPTCRCPLTEATLCR
jgi:hypothetical protein